MYLGQKSLFCCAVNKYEQKNRCLSVDFLTAEEYSQFILYSHLRGDMGRGGHVVLCTLEYQASVSNNLMPAGERNGTDYANNEIYEGLSSLITVQMAMIHIRLLRASLRCT